MIVVTTPTGLVGHQVLDRLLDRPRQVPVRVIARDPARLDPHVHERVEVVKGSHRDRAVLSEAFAGAESVFWIVPPDHHGETPRDYYLEFTRPGCEAFVEHRVRRVVAVTSLGHGYRGEAGHLSGAMAMDELIQATGVGYRGLAAPFFLENLLGQAESIRNQGVFSMAIRRDRPLANVATRDIAALAAQLLLDPAWSDQAIVPVTGPEDLTPEQMAAIMSEVLARPVHYQQITVADFKAMLTKYGMAETWAQGLADMVLAQNDGIYDAEPHLPPSLSHSTGFRTWCEQHLAK